MAAPNANLDPSKQITITNNSGKPVVVMVPTTSDTPDDPGDIMVYGVRLEILTAIDGSLSIADSGKATFVLNQNYTDSVTGKQEYSTIYDLLVSSAEWYSPVANISVMQSLDNPPTYPAQTVTSNQAKALANAGVFYQTISSYPTSKLATDYQTAMSATHSKAKTQAQDASATAGQVAATISGGADAFFKNTKSFQDVTLAGVVAVETYFGTFPFVWAKFGDATYYLYGSDGKATSFVGTIALTKPTTVDPAVANGGYTCTFTPASNPTDTTKVDTDSSQAKSLTYADGLFVDDPDSDVPGIAVKGTFQLKRTFTQKTADTQIIPVLSGTINGSVCIGFDSAQKSDDKTNSEFWDALFHPKNSSEIFKSIMSIGGAVMMLFFFGQLIYGTYKWIKTFGTKEPTLSDLQKSLDDFQKSTTDKIDSAIKKMTNDQQKAPADPDAANDSIVEARDAVGDNLNAANIQEGLESQAASLQEMGQYASEMSAQELQDLQGLARDVRSINNALNGATESTLSNVVSNQKTAFDGLRTDVSNLSKGLSTSLSQQSQSTIDDNAQLADDVSQQIDDAESDAQGEVADDDPIGDDPIIEV